MAHYQILYWRYIPLGVKATDINGTIRKNLPHRFQQNFQQAAASRDKEPNTNPYTTSGFRWGAEQERDGTASEVADSVINELTESWNVEDALAEFEVEQPELDEQFLNLNRLEK